MKFLSQSIVSSLYMWLALAAPRAHAADGLVTTASEFGVKETINRLEAAVKAGGATVFARIDHAGGAAAVGLPLRPTEVLVFGNPKGGTPLMQLQQTIGIDLPMKALAWEDAAGQTWLSYNDPVWLARRHGIDTGSMPALAAMADGLKALTAKAANAR